MTQEQKAKAYDEALERARKIHDEIVNNEVIGFPGQITDIFPELRESEDERIIRKQKELPFVKDVVLGYPGLYYYDGERMHFQGSPAMEEKQKEQKPYGQRDECKDCQANYAGSCKGSCEMKRQEQKPSEQKVQKIDKWSKKDKKILQSLHHVMNCADAQNVVKQDGLSVEDVCTFLFSIEPNWKPSKEQMEAFKIYLYEPQYIDNSEDIKIKLVESLYEDLKKLM